jgi:hypothetical protein
MTGTETPIAFSEEQTLRHLAEETWTRQGNRLVSRDSFSPAAVNQYSDALSRDTRDALKLRSEPSRTGDALSDARKLVLDARSAEAFFKKQALTLNEQDGQLSGNRGM